MKGPIKIHAKPKLNAPVMLAAWPGIGNVSIILATYLKGKLDFKDLAEIEASYFFDPIGVVVRDNVVESPQFPQSKFYYWKNKVGKNGFPGNRQGIEQVEFHSTGQEEGAHADQGPEDEDEIARTVDVIT